MLGLEGLEFFREKDILWLWLYEIDLAALAVNKFLKLAHYLSGLRFAVATIKMVLNQLKATHAQLSEMLSPKEDHLAYYALLYLLHVFVEQNLRQTSVEVLRNGPEFNGEGAFGGQ